MAETTGLVQRLSILSGTLTCVWIGPTESNSEALAVTHDGSATDLAFATSVIQALAAASTNYRQVVAVHGDSDSKITHLRIEPV
jgi:hypothetical protein